MSMTYIRRILSFMFGLTLLISAVLIGTKCFAESSLDKNWGRSFESAKHLQTLNPEAGKDSEPVTGLYGPAGERIIKGYIAGGKSEKQPPTEFGVITIKQ